MLGPNVLRAIATLHLKEVGDKKRCVTAHTHIHTHTNVNHSVAVTHT